MAAPLLPDVFSNQHVPPVRCNRRPAHQHRHSLYLSCAADLSVDGLQCLGGQHDRGPEGQGGVAVRGDGAPVRRWMGDGVCSNNDGAQVVHHSGVQQL